MTRTLKDISHLFLSDGHSVSFPPVPPSLSSGFHPSHLFLQDTLTPNQDEWVEISRLCLFSRTLIAGLLAQVHHRQSESDCLKELPTPTEPSGGRTLDSWLPQLERMAGDLEQKQEAVELIRTVQLAKSSLQERFQSLDVNYEVTGSGFPIRLQGNRQLLLELFQRVFENSLDALPGASSPARINIGFYTQPETAYVVLSDNGTGIESEVLSRMFFPFFTTRQKSGLGLFWICRIIELHEGQMKLWSQPGLGTEIYIRLPVAG